MNKFINELRGIGYYVAFFLLMMVGSAISGCNPIVRSF